MTAMTPAGKLHISRKSRVCYNTKLNTSSARWPSRRLAVQSQAVVDHRIVAVTSNTTARASARQLPLPSVTSSRCAAETRVFPSEG